ncbi:pilin [Kangiella geojedonensis]|uniref:Fimbrial protein n=1 Tax=Kangiella geojedonensis TaxID=914150 RepID=A0A0F6TR93_9GAMM|nr:pilin [Kangiella geojedonensis]AKE52629.1 fimbrial protein [Kangiella geojedonensis]
MQTKKQAGFTLIELMIVVAIVGILAAVAIPAYQDYIKRSKVSELLGAMAACKTSVSETYSSNGNNLGSIDTAASGCNTTATQYMSQLAVSSGVITVTATNIGTGVDNGTLSLTPTEDTTNGIVTDWTCSSSNIGTQYVPSNCR